MLTVGTVARILFDEALALLFVTVRGARRPPRAHVAVGIVLAALIVETVYDLVADHLLRRDGRV